MLAFAYGFPFLPLCWILIPALPCLATSFILMLKLLFTIRPVDLNVFNALPTYAHLMDIAYCISPISKINMPFKCNLQCSSSFPNLRLVHQWYFEDAVSGYIAVTNTSLFAHSIEGAALKKTILISLRGTRSFDDVLADVDIEQIPYVEHHNSPRVCGAECRVHRGFYTHFQNTLAEIEEIVHRQVDTQNYELLIIGHSLGGSAALLLGLHFLGIGYDSMRIVTMGQPLLGNAPFVKYVDDVLGSRFDASISGYERKYWRIVRKKDIITVIPRPVGSLSPYTQFDNQIYLNATRKASPSSNCVVDCGNDDSSLCIEGDFAGSIGVDGQSSLYHNHMLYFRKMGQCGFL